MAVDDLREATMVNGECIVRVFAVCEQRVDNASLVSTVNCPPQRQYRRTGVLLAQGTDKKSQRGLQVANASRVNYQQKQGGLLLL